MKPGTRIEVSALRLDGSVSWEPATVARWTREMGGRSSLPPGYEPVRFANGHVMMIHANRMRVYVPAAAPPRNAFATRYHRDGTVTIWDVYTQGWIRTSRPRDSILASLDERERARVIRHCNIT